MLNQLTSQISRKAAFVVAVVTAAASPRSWTQAQAATISGLALFSNILPTLQQMTSVPILLPSSVNYEIPLYAYISPNAGPTYGMNSAATPVTSSRYIVTVGTTSTCDVRVSCAYATIAGFSPGDAEVPALLGTSTTTLNNGSTAYFAVADCSGAHCGDASLAWRYGGYSYIILGKGMLLSDLQTLANAMVPPNQLQ